MDRRGMLAALGSLAVVPLAGCQSSDEPATTDPLEKTDYRLRNVTVTNLDDTAHTIDFVLLRDGEGVYWDTADVEPKSEGSGSVTTFDVGDVSDEPAPWTVYARHSEQTDGTSFTSAELVGEDGCIWPTIIVGRDGELGHGERFTKDGCP